MRSLALALFVTAALTATSPSDAAQDLVFCQIEGESQGVIATNDLPQEFAESIPVLALSGGFITPYNQSSGQIEGHRQYQPLAIVKNLDNTTPKLFLAGVNNESLSVNCKFYLTNKGGKSSPYYFQIALTKARLIESAVSNYSDDPRSTETLKFVFEKIEIEDPIGGTSVEDTWAQSTN